MPTGILGVIERVIWVLKSVKNLWLFLLDYLGFLKNKIIVFKTRNGLSVLARAGTTDKSELVLVFSDREYPKKYFPSKKRPVIVDVGAHIGTFTLYIYKELKKKEPIVYAIEPSLSNFDLLKKNCQKNGVRAGLFNVAISDKNGIGYIDLRKDTDNFSVESTPGREKAFFQSCRTLTLEEFCREHGIGPIDLLKVDGEGAEYRIFPESIDFIKKRVKKILIEVHEIDRKKSYANFEKFMLKHGFIIENKIFPTVVLLSNSGL